METGPEQLLQIERRYSREYDYPPADLIRIARAVELIGSNARVLDVGAFDGFISEKIAQVGNDVVAFDGSQPALDIAARRGLKTAKGDIAAKWDFPDDSFDVVFAGEIIEHIVDTDAFLQQCHRVLRRGGRLILTTPNLASLGRRILLLLGKNPYIDTAVRADQAGHVRFFVRESLEALLRENNFAPRSFRADSIVFTASGKGFPVRFGWLNAFAKSIIVEATRP